MTKCHPADHQRQGLVTCYAAHAGHDGIQNGQHSQLAQCRLKQIADSSSHKRGK